MKKVRVVKKTTPVLPRLRKGGALNKSNVGPDLAKRLDRRYGKPADIRQTKQDDGEPFDED